MPDSDPPGGGYEAIFRAFDSPLMQLMRREAYAEDFGQHSWVTAREMRRDIERLGLAPASRFLDLGCGPCGPLTMAIAMTRCRGSGIELSPAALQAGRTRAAALGIEPLFSVQEGNLDDGIPFADATFDAVTCLDVVLHLRDRERLFQEVARLLISGGRFLLTDAGVITGSVSNEEIRLRSRFGFTQFVVPGVNEQLLRSAGLELLEREDRTRSVLDGANGRLRALKAHQAELERLSSPSAVAEEARYLETVIGLSRRRALSRIMYLVEAGDRHADSPRGGSVSAT